MGGILMGAFGGAGEALQQIGARNQQADLQRENELAVGKQRSDLELERQRTMEVFRENQRNAPLTRLGAKAKEMADQEVPVEAPAPVTRTGGILNPGEMAGVDGKPIQMQGGSDKGLVGDIAKLRQQIQNDPNISDEDRAGALAQLDAQAGQENKANADSVAGKTRKRTSDEALKAATEDAKVNDPVAYAAYESQIGKPLRDERRVDNQEKRLDQQDANTNRRLDIQQQFNEDRAKYQDRLAEIAEKRAQRMEDRTGVQMDKAEMQSTRQSLTSVLKDIGTQEDKIQMKLMDPMLSPEQKAVLESQFKTLDKDRVQARNELLKLAGVEPKAEEVKKPTNTWDSTTGEVVSNGQVVGKAASPAEAQALIAKSKTATTQQAPATQVQATAPQPSTNEVGYYDVQGTIDGARRGDKRALAYLQTLIDRGETTPAQRQQIAKITGQK